MLYNSVIQPRPDLPLSTLQREEGMKQPKVMERAIQRKRERGGPLYCSWKGLGNILRSANWGEPTPVLAPAIILQATAFRARQWETLPREEPPIP